MSTNVTGFINKHPVPTYFALTFAISWGGVLGVGPGGFLGTPSSFRHYCRLRLL